MLRLAELSKARLRWTGPAGLAPAAALARLRPLLAALGPHHAALLATPAEGAEAIAWDAPGNAQRGLPGLNRHDRAVFAASLTLLLSDIRRAAETARAEGDADRAALLDLARMVPTQDTVFAVDGVPVLAAWGFAAADGPVVSALARFDDATGAAPVARDRTAMWLAAAALVAFGAAALFAAPVLRGMLEPPLPACQVNTEELAALRDLDLLREQGRALAGEREAWRLSRGRQQQDCPLPQAPPQRQPEPPPPEPPPAPTPAPPPRPTPPPPAPPPPPPRTDLPAERWNRGDLALLEGCWNLASDYRTRDVRTGRVNTVRAWRVCFDRAGQGRQTLTFDNGAVCEGPARGSFEGRNLLIDDVSDLQCDDQSYIYRRISRCERANDSRAECETTQPGQGTRSRVTFQR